MTQMYCKSPGCRNGIEIEALYLCLQFILALHVWPSPYELQDGSKDSETRIVSYPKPLGPIIRELNALMRCHETTNVCKLHNIIPCAVIPFN